MNIGLITEAHCAAGIKAFDTFGHLLPKFWVQSHKQRLLAEPAREEGLEMSSGNGVQMLSMMCDVIGGKYIGRTVEAWMRQFGDGDQIPVEGLASIAETDPEVRTSIIAQGFDLATSTSHTACATFDLQPDATPIWSRFSDASTSGQFDLVAWAVVARQLCLRDLLQLADLEAFADRCGWRLSIFGA